MPGPGRGVRGYAKPKNAKKTIARIFGYFKPYTFQLVIIVLGIILGAGASIAGTYMLKPIINDYIVPWIGNKNPDFTGLIRQLTIMAVLYMLGVIGSYVYNRLMINVSTGTLLKLRSDMFTHMQKLPIGYFDKRTHGEIMSRYTNDTDAMREMISQGIPSFISSGIRIVGVFAMMVILSLPLTGVAVAMLIIMLLLTKAIAKRSGRYFKARQESLGAVNGYIEEMIEGQKVVKVFCHEQKVGARFAQLNSVLCENTAEASTWATFMGPIMNNLSHITYALTAAAGGLLGVSGILDLGTLASFLQYSNNFAMPIVEMSQQMNNVMSALAGAERIFELLDEPVETDDGDVELFNVKHGENGEPEICRERTGLWAWKGKDGVLVPVRGEVRLKDVTFSYDGKTEVLSDVSFYAKPGQKIALVGSTGAGKTTITNLINRFYDINEGEITYDGIPVNRMKKDSLRRSLSMVLQDTHLFTGTVRENIRYGRLDATDDEVVTAAKLANAHYFITHLPEGYDTVLTADGANLSQGQRQLLAIARAAVADPPVLVLDEATSSIDTRTEAHIERGMDQLMRGRTVFVIAHRLSTVRNSNAIMVLEHGRIIERGDHANLLAQKGKYYQLYMGMFELS